MKLNVADPMSGWQSAPSMDVPRSHFHMGVSSGGGKLWAVGGFTQWNSGCTDIISSLDLNVGFAAAWTQEATMPYLAMEYVSIKLCP